MTLFRVELRKAITLDNSTGYRKWRNTFYVDTTTPILACTQVHDGWKNILRDCVRDKVYAYQVYATDMLPSTSNYHIMAIEEGFQRGNITTPDELYAVDNCLAVNITVPVSRPSRKFWRAGYCESDYNQGVFSNTTFINLINTKFDDLIGSFEFRDIDGQLWVSTLITKPSLRTMGKTTRFDVPNPPPVG